MKAIGGFFELELAKGEDFYPNLLKLNTGRNCLEYILRAGKIKKLYLPLFSCIVLLEPLKKLNIDYEYYQIDQDFNPIIHHLPEKDEALLYINYFGIKNSEVENLSKRVTNLIVDNSQAFFSAPISGTRTFYSARKFFGVSDGAYLSTNQKWEVELLADVSCDRFDHLLQRVELGPEKAYSIFVENGKKLSGQPILKMSKLTQQLLAQVDYAAQRNIRNENFLYLHKNLSAKNHINISLAGLNGPMVYPFYNENDELRRKLIEQKIFVATYWPNVLTQCDSNSLEYKFAKYLLPLPIDQRYNIEDMARICEVLESLL